MSLIKREDHTDSNTVISINDRIMRILYDYILVNDISNHNHNYSFKHKHLWVKKAT
jgi:hypothetical protein